MRREPELEEAEVRSSTYVSNRQVAEAIKVISQSIAPSSNLTVCQGIRRDHLRIRPLRVRALRRLLDE